MVLKKVMLFDIEYCWVENVALPRVYLFWA